MVKAKRVPEMQNREMGKELGENRAGGVPLRKHRSG